TRAKRSREQTDTSCSGRVEFLDHPLHQSAGLVRQDFAQSRAQGGAQHGISSGKVHERKKEQEECREDSDEMIEGQTRRLSEDGVLPALSPRAQNQLTP